MPMTPPPIDAFPWQREALRSALAGCATLPHALLISSAPGYGAGQFASALAAALLCESGAVLADAKACGHCAACGWMLAGHHPDFRLLGLDTGEEEGAVAGDGAAESESGSATLQAAPRAGSKSASTPSKSGAGVKRRPEIKIDDVRGLGNFAILGASRAGRRVILINPADRLNLAAANALLKMLEEPTPGVHFLLATESSAKLLATVRSRCVSLNLKTPSAELVRQWLSASAALSAEVAQHSLDSCGGAPVAALAMLDAGQTQTHQTVLAAISSIPQADPLDVAQRLESIAPAIWVPILQRWIEDLARACAGAPARSRSSDYRRLVAIAARSNPVALSQFAQFLTAQRKAVDHPLNPKLFSEAILVAFSASFSPRQA